MCLTRCCTTIHALHSAYRSPTTAPGPSTGSGIAAMSALTRSSSLRYAASSTSSERARVGTTDVQTNDHPSYPFGRAPWALVTGVGPLTEIVELGTSTALVAIVAHRTTEYCSWGQ